MWLQSATDTFFLSPQSPRQEVSAYRDECKALEADARLHDTVSIKQVRGRGQGVAAGDRAWGQGAGAAMTG